MARRFCNRGRSSNRNCRHRDRLYRIFRPGDGDQHAIEFGVTGVDDRMGGLRLDALNSLDEARLRFLIDGNLIYNWFTGGVDTGDLKDAKALLDELSV